LPPAAPAPATDGRTLAASVSASVQSAADHVLQSAQHVTDSALDLIGVRYKFGGESPDKGLDCSGLVRYVFEQVTGVTLPHSAREQAKIGDKVDLDELQPGDLVFFNTRRFAFSHVGIYIGDNSFIHAPNRRNSVKVASIEGRYWKKRFNGARRLLEVMPGVVSIEAAKSSSIVAGDDRPLPTSNAQSSPALPGSAVSLNSRRPPTSARSRPLSLRVHVEPVAEQQQPSHPCFRGRQASTASRRWARSAPGLRPWTAGTR
jgi:hypothetical protein